MHQTLDTVQVALRGSVARLSHLKRPWCGATDAAATFVLTLLTAGMERAVCEASHHSRWHGRSTCLAVAPKTVGFRVDQASLIWSDSSVH